MALATWNGYPLINDESPMDDLVGAIGPDGAERMRGCVPRDYSVQPAETFAPPSDIQVIPESEWADRIKEQDEQKSSLEHIYLSGPGGAARFVNLDQNGNGFCLRKGARVLMANGTLRRIEEVRHGDEVISHKYRRQRVIRPTSRLYDGPMRSVTVGERSLTVTSEHEFYDPRADTWVTACDLEPGSTVLHNAQRRDLPEGSLTDSHTSGAEEVHCLEVAGDHSFIAEGFAVHNCWAYSTGHCTMLARLRDNMPMVRLNPHSVASIIKGGRDEGGWCGLSAKFLRENGIAPEGDGPGEWPLFSRRISLDTPAMRTSMARFKTTEDWVDLTQPVYDQTLSRGQIGTALLSNQPTALDFAWWGHSVCGVRVVQVEPGSFGWLILNSWKGWGRSGLGVIQGSKMGVMGAVSLRVIRAAD